MAETIKRKAGGKNGKDDGEFCSGGIRVPPSLSFLSLLLSLKHDVSPDVVIFSIT